MYCDFCGKQLTDNVKFCRHCGQMLRNKTDDTKPLPVVTESMLANRHMEEKFFLRWLKLPLLKKNQAGRVRLWSKICQIASCVTLIVVVFILATFTTIKEYQILTTIAGCLLAIYSWQKGKIR